MAERAFMYISTLGGSLTIPDYLQHLPRICFEYLGIVQDLWADGES
jgi:hypothetical protein